MWFKVYPNEHEYGYSRYQVPGRLSNKEYIDTALQWYKSCTQNTHPQCHTYRKEHSRRTSLPSRLLYFPRDQTLNVHLVEVQMEQIYQYATLSHRWGTPEPLKLSCNSDDHRKISYNTMIKGISTSDLPRIFREALQIIHHFKLEYLWIDSLCINQDNDNDGIKREWELEAVKIGDIYAGGVFNIAAIDSRNSDGTLFPEKREFFVPVVRDSFGQHGTYKEGHLLVGVFPESDAEFERQVLSSELLARGWVYQEVILAPANLFCTAQQMWWLCHTGRYCQNRFTATYAGNPAFETKTPDASLSKGRQAIANPGRVPGSLQFWGELLRLYSKTSVTFKDDRLVAIAGLSKVFQSVFPKCVEHGSYNSGFWSTNIIFQLSWHTTSSKVALNRYTADHFIPSWSPVSCKSEISYPWKYEQSFQLPIECTMNTLGLDSFGRAESMKQCILHLRGVPIDMTLGPGRSPRKVWPSLHPDSEFEILWDNQAEIDLAKKACLTNGLKALILSVAEPLEFIFEGILLRSLRDDGLTTPDKWVRCGYLQHSSHYGRRAREISNAFQLTRYGLTWVEDEFGFLKRVSTGTAPNLEDIYLV